MASPELTSKVGGFCGSKHDPFSWDLIDQWKRKQPDKKSIGWIRSKHRREMTDEERALSACYESSVAIAEVEEKIEARFQRLSSEWAECVRSVSSVTAIVNHPKYREIVSLGWDVVPFLLRDVQNRRGFWFPALAEITTIRPYDPQDAGNNKRMSEAWLKWGRHKQLI